MKKIRSSVIPHNGRASAIRKSLGVTKEDETIAGKAIIFTQEQEELRQKAKNGDLGIKFDDERNRWDLLPWREIEQVVKILTFGAKKYADDNWKYIPDLKKRYFAAAMRHLVAWQKGEMLDQESGENHLSHALCCILFLLWDDNQSGKS
jgi:hypothetical protein